MFKKLLYLAAKMTVYPFALCYTIFSGSDDLIWLCGRCDRKLYSRDLAQIEEHVKNCTGRRR